MKLKKVIHPPNTFTIHIYPEKKVDHLNIISAVRIFEKAKPFTSLYDKVSARIQIKKEKEIDS